MFKRIITGALVFGMVATAPPVAASEFCHARDEIIDGLVDKYQERLAGGGLQNAQNLVEVWTSAETGTWTMLVTNVNGTSCVVASGTNWHFEPEPKPNTDPES